MPVAASLIARFRPATASGALAARIGGQRFSAGRQLLDGDDFVQITDPKHLTRVDRLRGQKQLSPLRHRGGSHNAILAGEPIGKGSDMVPRAEAPSCSGAYVGANAALRLAGMLALSASINSDKTEA
jgi:hypothetical protein